MTDFLGLNADDDDDARGPAMVLAAPVGDHELRALEELYRRGSKVTGGQSLVLFTHEVDGVEYFDRLEADRWQKMMAWPVPPSVAEAQQFALSLDGQMIKDGWPALARARELDEAAAAAGIEGLFERSLGATGTRG